MATQRTREQALASSDEGDTVTDDTVDAPPGGLSGAGSEAPPEPQPDESTPDSSPPAEGGETSAVVIQLESPPDADPSPSEEATAPQGPRPLERARTRRGRPAIDMTSLWNAAVNAGLDPGTLEPTES